MYQAGYPEFTVTAAYDSSAGKLTLTVTQTQVDTSKADSTGLRYTTPLVFTMPVTIRVGTTAGDVVQRAQLDQRADTITIPGVKSAPTMVVFDDGNTILKQLTFDQPTTWLATQLARDPDLWNRQWVIEQLAGRKDDSLAAAALVRAATSADYFLTREEAVKALDSVPAAVALPALARAMTDTSAQVRAAAAAALGNVGGDQAMQLARTAWTTDTSYGVRANALMTLAQLDTANRHALIAQGLATPSYQSAIAGGAMRAIIQSNDTSFIPRIDSMAGGAIEPSFVLAVLGARGSAHALDLLFAHLNDDRPQVRRWALIAITNALPHPIATQRLTAAKADLKYDDTKQAVDRALERLARPGGQEEDQ
jgi:hypothetical protein